MASNNKLMICIAHGHERRTDLMNVVEMKIKNVILCKKVLGLPYLRMEPNWDQQKMM